MNQTPATANVPHLDEASAEQVLASIRISQSYSTAATGVGITKPLLMVPLRKPSKTEFFRVHPEHHLDCFMVELKEERETYLVSAGLVETLAAFVEQVKLRLCVTRQGVTLIWPIKALREDQRGDQWRRSAAEAASLAEARWVRVAADMNLGAYQPYVATGELGEPKWPTEAWPEVVRIATRDCLIDRKDHPVIRRLLGEE